MEELWRVDRNTGGMAVLKLGLRKREIARPQFMTRHGFFCWLAPGSVISAETLRSVVKVWSTQ
jgi:hypothetical protein